MIKRIVIVLLFPLCIFSCNKEVTEVDPNYTGNWIGPEADKTYYLNISEQSDAVFIIVDDEGNKEEKKGILRKNEDKLIMKNVFVYEVLEEPFQLDSTISFVLHDYEHPVTWKMILKTPKSWGGGEISYYK